MDYSGTLLVRTYTTRAQLPLEGTTVAITQPNPDEKPALLALAVTNESGRTVPLTIPAPPPRDSRTPNPDTGYALVNVWAYQPGFQPMVVRGVQIFPEVATIQNMALMPLSEYATPQEEQSVVRITPQPL